MTNDITQGQIRVREIIFENLHIYSSLRDREDIYSDEVRHLFQDLYSEIGRLFSVDPIITSDSVTTQSLIKPNISHHYLEWLRNNGSVEEISCKDDRGYEVTLDRFCYNPPALKNRLIAYEGGDKCDSTYSCLFGLARGEKIEPYNWTPTYYKKEGILDTSGGGCHRSLSHVLWGKTYITPHTLTIVEEFEIDPDFNNILLEVEDRSRAHNYYFQIKDYSDGNEKDTIKNIFSSENYSEMETVFRFLREPESKHYASYEMGHYGLYVSSFQNILKDLKKVKSRTQLQIIKLKISKLLGFSKNIISPIETWLDRTVKNIHE